MLQLSEHDNDAIVGMVGLGPRHNQIINGRPLLKKIKMTLDELNDCSILELDIIKNSMDDFNRLIHNTFDEATIALIKSELMMC
jgi:hypothetical protein